MKVQVECMKCGKSFMKEDYYIRKSPKNFCSRSCAAKHNNLGREIGVRRPCLNCQALTLNKKYCSGKCSSEHWSSQAIQRTIDLLESGVGLTGDERGVRRRVKAYLIHKHGTICSVCSGSTWMGKEMPLNIDHIDGNPTNHVLTNFRLICPNCDRQSETWGARNMGNGRRSLGLRTD